MSEQRYPQEVIERAEILVNRIQGVSSCRISTDEVGAITEIHVVALPHKAAKLVARDVESCLKAELGMEVDHRKIGVVVITAGRPERTRTARAGRTRPPIGSSSFPSRSSLPVSSSGA